MYELSVITKEDNFAPVKDVLVGRGIGIISEEPTRKIHMFYPVKKERYGFLNVVRFESAPETLNDLAADLKLKGEVLRFIVTKARIALAEERIERVPAPVRREVVKTTPPKTVDPALTNEELERKIEEILK